MAVVLSKTYQAFLKAGVPPKEAEEASEEIAGLYRRLIRLEVMIGIIIAGVGYIIIMLHAQ